MIVEQTSRGRGARERIAIVSSGRPGAMAVSVRRGFETSSAVDAVTVVPYSDWGVQTRFSARGAGLVNKVLKSSLRPALEVRGLAALAAFDPTLVLFLKADDLSAMAYRAARTLTGATLVAFHPDDPWNRGTFTRPGPAHRRALAQMKAVDHVFLWSHGLCEKARSVGIRAHYLPFACDPVLHPKVEGVTDDDRRRLGADVVFIGNWDEEREQWLSPLAESGVDLAVWGSTYWRERCRNPALRRAWRGRPLFAEEQATAVAASKIHINVLRRQNKGSTNMRTFELPSMGAFMLHERSSEAAAIFPPGEACDDFATPQDLVLKVREWLGRSEAERARIVEAGHRIAMQHTYSQWASTMLQAVRGAAGGGTS